MRAPAPSALRSWPARCGTLDTHEPVTQWALCESQNPSFSLTLGDTEGGARNGHVRDTITRLVDRLASLSPTAKAGSNALPTGPHPSPSAVRR